jgi:voltage-gated potassium channel Kch
MVIASVVLMMFVVALVESSIWAATYVAVGAISEFEPALYFSTVTFTTLGYGDIVLPDGWRLLASFQAANGIIMFGWTTAMIVAVAHYLHSGHAADDRS